MSLVSDALKKAQRDAALREARDKGLPEPLLATAQPFRAKRAGPRAVPLALALSAAALLAAGGVWLFSVSKEQDERLPVMGVGAPTAAPESALAAPARAPSAETAASAAPSSGPLGATPSVETVAEPTGAALVAPGPEPAQERAQPAPAGAAPVPIPPSMEVSGQPSAGAVSGAAPAPLPPAPQAQEVEGDRTFVRVARLADGTEVRLGGIAWSEQAPLAYLNGKLLGTGESVAGLRVARIDRDRVRLEGAGTTVVLTLR